MNNFLINRKWTWPRSAFNAKNEVGFIITDSKEIVQDVTVLNRFSVGSDHRIVRVEEVVNTRAEKRKKIRMVSKKRQFHTNDTNEYILSLLQKL